LNKKRQDPYSTFIGEGNALELARRFGLKPAARQLNMCLPTLDFKPLATETKSFDCIVENHASTSGGERPSSMKGNFKQQLIAFVDAQHLEENKVTVQMLIALLRNLAELLKLLYSLTPHLAHSQLSPNCFA
jgi:hypothetical protein